MSTIRYIPSSLAAQVAEKPILRIYACAHPANPVAGPGSPLAGTMTNHWVFYCAISENSSLRLDPSPSGPNLSIVPLVALKQYLTSVHAVKTCQLDTSNLTFGRFVALIESNTYDKYQFTTGGQGCRYWVYSVVNLLRSQGYLSNTSQVQAATNALATVWAQSGQPLPASQQSGITPGTFYALK